MKCDEIRLAFPGQWVLIEAIQAYTNEQSERKEDPARELYVLHTGYKSPILLKRNGQVSGDIEKLRIDDDL